MFIAGPKVLGEGEACHHAVIAENLLKALGAEIGLGRGIEILAEGRAGVLVALRGGEREAYA